MIRLSSLDHRRPAAILGIFVLILLFSTSAFADISNAEDEASVPTSVDPKEAAREERRAAVDAILQRDPDEADYVDQPRCLSTRRIRKVSVLDEQHVNFQVGRSDNYLVQFKRRCPGLRRNKGVVYETRVQRLCQNDSLRAISEFGEMTVRCQIPKFQSITPEQLAMLKETLRKKPRKKKREVAEQQSSGK